MTLQIETFKNADMTQGWRPGNNAGGVTLFKALSHPLVASMAHTFMASLKRLSPVAIYDPTNMAATFHAYYDLSQLSLAGYYVQRFEDLENTFLGHKAKPISEITSSTARTILVLLFDAQRKLLSIRHLFPKATNIVSLDEMRLPDDMLSIATDYLNPLNFVTNFALMRECTSTNQGDALHTRIASVNYWAQMGATDPELWLCLFNKNGEVLAQWRESLPAAGASFVIDSHELRNRFHLDDFMGSLFIHALRVQGHDIMKYVLDVYGENELALSCSHDANPWPADFYAGVIAGEPGETVTLFVQNSHPVTIPKRAIGFNIVGGQDITWYEDEIPPFATREIDLSATLSQARWPDQIEITAGRHFVRPRFETKDCRGHRRFAHANVERSDLKPDPHLPTLGRVMGKGYIMPLPVLPCSEFISVMVPTPMARTQHELPLRVELVDASGQTVDSNYLGRIPRRACPQINIEQWLIEKTLLLPSGYGHVEFLYDFRNDGDADGWLHALGRFERKSNGHRAETIFGAHIYNVPLVYKDEPQSYTNRPPGLTTRLFLRLGAPDLETICHLVYPASQPWHAHSNTMLVLYNSLGIPISEIQISIPCGGSRFLRVSELFEMNDLARASGTGYIIVRDQTCRIFGFHGLIGKNGFCLDHMFGF